MAGIYCRWCIVIHFPRWNVNFFILILLKFIHEGLINKKSSLVKIIAWQQANLNQLLHGLRTHISVIRPWCVYVNTHNLYYGQKLRFYYYLMKLTWRDWSKQRHSNWAACQVVAGSIKCSCISFWSPFKASDLENEALHQNCERCQNPTLNTISCDSLMRVR